MTDRDDLLRRVRRANPAPPEGALPAEVADSRPPVAWLIEGKHAMADATPSAERHRWRGPAIAGTALAAALAIALPLFLVRGGEERGPQATMPAVGARTECPPGSQPDAFGPTDQARPELSGPYAPAVVMDTEAGMLVAVEIQDEEARTWLFDVCTNTWWPAAPAREPDLGAGARLVYDPDARLTVAFRLLEGAAIWAYSSTDNTWTELPAAHSTPSPFWWFSGDLVFDPVSGLILLRDPTTADLWAYDVEATTWSVVEQGGTVPAENPNQSGLGPHFHSLLAYDSEVDRLVLTLLGDALAAGQTWTFDPRAGAWSQQSDSPPPLNTGYFELGGEATFDAATGRTVVFSDGLLGLYDAAADTWEAITDLPGWPTPGLNSLADAPSGPLARMGHTLVYDPLNRRVILVGGHARFEDRWWPVDDVWAIDLRERKLVELLPGTVPEMVVAPESAGEAHPWSRGPLVAVSSEEAWAVMTTAAEAAPVLLAHLEDGSWTFYRLTVSREEDPEALIRGLAVAPDGTVWAATGAGTFSFDGERWTRRSIGRTAAVAVAEDGTVWTGGPLPGPTYPTESLWLARWDGESFVRMDPTPDTIAGVGSAVMTVAADGEVWIGSSDITNTNLVRYDGTTLQAVGIVDQQGASPDTEPASVGILAIEPAPNGNLWVGGYLAADRDHVVVAHLDDEEWTVYDWPFPDTSSMGQALNFGIAVGPDNVVWFAFDGGLGSFDGTTWTTHLEGQHIARVDVAPDGTVWYTDLDGVHTLETP